MWFVDYAMVITVLNKPVTKDGHVHLSTVSRFYVMCAWFSAADMINEACLWQSRAWFCLLPRGVDMKVMQR